MEIEQILQVKEDMVAFNRTYGGTGNRLRQPHFYEHGRDGRNLFKQDVNFPDLGDLRLRLKCSTGPEIDDGAILQIALLEFCRLPFIAQFRAKGTVMSVTMGFSGFHEGEITSGQIIFKAPINDIIQGAGYKEQGPSSEEWRKVHGFWSSSLIPPNTTVEYKFSFKFEEPLLGLGHMQPRQIDFGEGSSKNFN